jgi:hypothetical protein
MVNELGMAAAGVLAATFAWAGAAKLGRPADAAAGFGSLGLRRPEALARGVPILELALAVALLAAPVLGAATALVLLACFSVVLGRALRRGVDVHCACFGSAGGPPLSWVELARNALLGGLAALALTAGLEPRLPGLVPAAAVLLTTAAAALLLAFLRHGRMRP